MKKYILAALFDALVMLVLCLSLFVGGRGTKCIEKYEHIDFISAISTENCFVCSGQGAYWGEDNVGIVNLNTFELLHVAINCYGNHGERVREPAGFMQKSSLIDQNNNLFVHAIIFPDEAFAMVEMSGVTYSIDRDSVQKHLCQNCLDSINSMWFITRPPAELAVVSFDERTIQPLLNTSPWFLDGNYGIDCEFEEDGEVDLLIHYAVNPSLLSEI